MLQVVIVQLLVKIGDKFALFGILDKGVVILTLFDTFIRQKMVQLFVR